MPRVSNAPTITRMRHLWLFGIVGLLSTAHADDAGKQKVANAIDAGDAKTVRALTAGKIVLEHVWFFDAACAKKFTNFRPPALQ